MKRIIACLLLIALIVTMSCGKDNANAPKILKVGDKYQGGIIAYILFPVDPGYDENVQHGFIVSESDIGTAKWSLCDDVPNGADGITLGTGKQNTLDILADCPAATNLAANLCANYSITEGSTIYDDWYSPSLDELKKLYLNNNTVGPLAKGPFWTSTEVSIGGAYTIDFGDGSISSTTKTLNAYVIAFRSF